MYREGLSGEVGADGGCGGDFSELGHDWETLGDVEKRRRWEEERRGRELIVKLSDETWDGVEDDLYTRSI